jgi:hypothetical protein
VVPASVITTSSAQAARRAPARMVKPITESSLRPTVIQTRCREVGLGVRLRVRAFALLDRRTRSRRGFFPASTLLCRSCRTGHVANPSSRKSHRPTPCSHDSVRPVSGWLGRIVLGAASYYEETPTMLHRSRPPDLAGAAATATPLATRRHRGATMFSPALQGLLIQTYIEDRHRRRPRPGCAPPRS